MIPIGQPERATQIRVIALFRGRREVKAHLWLAPRRPSRRQVSKDFNTEDEGRATEGTEQNSNCASRDAY